MVSVGIDMIEIERIEKCMKREGFLNKFFGEEEILQLKSKKFIIQSVAANFCAKEAFSKAIGTGIRRFKLREVEILRNEMGKPYIKLTGNAFDIAASNGYKFDVSLTHTKQFASAVVVCEKVGDDKMEIIRNYEYIQSINMDMVRKKLPFRSAFAHKGTFGTLVAVCGSVGMAGAATMCISSAVRCGVGLVRAVVPKGIYDIVAKQVVEAVYVLADENSDGTIGLSEVDKILNCLKKSTACVVGCGLGWNKDIKEILEKSLEGTEEIISPRSKIMKEKNINVNDMSLNELYEFIKNNPTVLKRPIIVADNRIQVGYNEEDIYEFIPKAKRIAQMYCSSEHCPTYNTCQHRIDSCGGDKNC